MARSPKKLSKSSSKSSSRSASPEKKSPRKRKAATSKSPKKQHPPYRDMIAEAIYEEKKMDQRFVASGDCEIYRRKLRRWSRNRKYAYYESA